MDRLTIRNSEGIGVLKQPFTCERCGDLQWSLPDLGSGSPVERLAEYEDTGITPEQIREIDRLYAEKCKELAKCKENYMAAMSITNIAIELKKLREYEDLKEQGKLLKLPCAVGDTVYVIPSKTNYKLNILNGHSENNRVYEQVVNRIEISKSGCVFYTCDGMASVINTFYKKTWFLTWKEAENTLKKHKY